MINIYHTDMKDKLAKLFELIDGADTPIKEVSEENKLKAHAAVEFIKANYKQINK